MRRCYRSELKEKDKNLESLNQQIANAKAADIFKNSTEINGISVIKADLGTSTPDELRKLGDSIKDKAEPVVALFAGVNGTKGTLYCVCTKEAVAKGANAGKIVREIAAVTGGKGGGKPDGAMAGAGDISKADDAVKAFADISNLQNNQ